MSHAYVDESDRRGSFGHRYALAATVPFGDEVDSYRTAMAGLLPVGQKKVRWYNSVDALKSTVAATVAEFEVMHCLVTRQMPEGENPEKARKLCLTRLAVELVEFGVDHVVFEARSPKLDQDDLKMLNYLRTSRTIPRGFTGEHIAGRDEAMLWIPDAICGAVGESWAGNAEYKTIIQHQLHVFPDAG